MKHSLPAHNKAGITATYVPAKNLAGGLVPGVPWYDATTSAISTIASQCIIISARSSLACLRCACYLLDTGYIRMRKRKANDPLRALRRLAFATLHAANAHAMWVVWAGRGVCTRVDSCGESS